MGLSHYIIRLSSFKYYLFLSLYNYLVSIPMTMWCISKDCIKLTIQTQVCVC